MNITLNPHQTYPPYHVEPVRPDSENIFIVCNRFGTNCAQFTQEGAWSADLKTASGTCADFNRVSYGAEFLINSHSNTV